MLGLGTGVVKGSIHGVEDLGIVKDNLVLDHSNYGADAVHQVSTGAASFTASNTDYIDCGDVCDLGTTDFSMCFWAYVPEGTSQDFISKHTSTSDRWFLQTDSSDKIQFQSRVSGVTRMSQAYSGDAVPQNEWFHVAVTCDRSDGSSGLKIYLNGVVGTASAASATGMDNAANLYFGRQDTNYMGGYIANVGIWSGKALTPAEVKSIWYKNYADLTSDEKTSLVSWWNLDSVIPESNSYSSTTTLVYDNHHSGGDTLGSELITGGDFGGGGANWSTGSGWTDTGGYGDWDTNVGGGNDRVYQTINALAAGKSYEVKFTISNNTSGRQLIRLDDGAGNTQDVTRLDGGSVTDKGYGQYTDGTHTLCFTATHAHTKFSVYGNDTYSSFRIDDISLKLINGNTGTLS